ncbi:peptidase S8/S53 domain-containing protein [Paraphysoderma sedebokerense]|nr:peptidase S8/S53 domain-containing protein [Paraphysoderma sedebokerense]
MAGVAWMVDQVKAKRSPHVAVLSLGGPRNEQLNQVVEAAIANGANIVVASGNSNMNSCDVSPASARGAITVSSSDRNDFKDPTANFGSCVDVFAPGVAITTATVGQRSIILSGSSLAAAHVAGVASLYLSELGNLSPSELRRLIMENATKDRLKNVMGSPNLLVYNTPLVR